MVFRPRLRKSEQAGGTVVGWGFPELVAGAEITSYKPTSRY
jgi:hypothetical protein